MNRSYKFYDQNRDSMFTLSWQVLFNKSNINGVATHVDDDTHKSDMWNFDSMVLEKIIWAWPSACTRLRPRSSRTA